MKQLLRFIRHYKLFCIALLSALVSLILEISKQSTLAHWILGVVSIIAVMPLLWNMWQDVRSGKYGIDILAATAIIASVLLSQYWAAIVVVLMLTGGEGLEDFAEHRARNELDSLLKHAPQHAFRIKKGKTLEVPVSELTVGDKILVKAGGVVPADALIIEGNANFDESSLTGESLPQPKTKSSHLLSGSINIDGPITAKVLVKAEDSQYQQIIRLVRGAAAAQTPFVRLADRYSLPFTFLAFGIGLIVWVLSGQAIRFLDVIVVATPCPLLLAAPIALISGMARASKYGIIVKTGSALEKLAEAKTIAFDKTGTLTYGNLVVESIKVYGTHSETAVLKLSASIEQNSHHVLANAIVSEAIRQNIKVAKAKHVKEESGLGMSAVIHGSEVLIGRYSFLERHHIKFPQNFNPKKFTLTATFVSIDNELAGIISFNDQLRDEAKSTIDQLHNLGIKETAMLTGDNQETANNIARELGITNIYAEMLPINKINIVESNKNRPLVFVGDGVNDAPALTAADVGIALGARGSTAASESADMVIMLDDLSHVVIAVSIAKRTIKIARQSILAGIGLSIALMLVFATGKFSPLEGAIMQEIVDVFVIFNALRAHLITDNI